MTQNSYTLTSIFQYATLYHLPDAITIWNTGEKSEDADSLYELFAKLGGECDEDSFALPRFLNLLGQKGWELTHIQDGEASTYTFKRRYNRD